MKFGCGKTRVPFVSYQKRAQLATAVINSTSHHSCGLSDRIWVTAIMLLMKVVARATFRTANRTNLTRYTAFSSHALFRSSSVLSSNDASCKKGLSTPTPVGGFHISVRSIYQSTVPPMVPMTEPFHETFLNRIAEIANMNPKLKAFVSAEDEKDFVTFGQLHDRILSTANYLQKGGLKKGDVCFTVLPNCWQFPVFYLATSMYGGVVSGASVMFKPNEMNGMIADSKSRMILTNQEMLPTVLEAIKGLSHVKEIVLVHHSDTKPLPLPSCGSVKLTKFEDIIEEKVTRETVTKVVPELSPHDDLMMPFSSGTTGRPKGVQITHQNFGTLIANCRRYFRDYLYSKANPKWKEEIPTSLLLALPFHHIYGVGVLFFSIAHARQCITMRKFDPMFFFKTIQNHKIAHMHLVPPQIICLAKHPESDKYDLSSIETITSGAAPLSPETVQLLQKRLPTLKFLGNAYGMTETSMAATIAVPGVGEAAYISSGKLLPNLEAKIVDPKTGLEVADGESGELLLRAPTIMKGYFNNPTATAETIRDGWLHTGDVAYHKDDHFYIVDRIKELIKVKGYQVAPAELEDILLAHSDVDDCAVIGIPDEKSGELPKAFVVRKANSKVTEEQLQKIVADQLVSYKHLKGGIEFIAQIPRSPSGKIMRKILRERSCKKNVRENAL